MSAAGTGDLASAAATAGAAAGSSTAIAFELAEGRDDAGSAAYIVIAPVDTTVGWQAADILQTRVHVKLVMLREASSFPPFVAEWTNPALKLSEFTDGAGIDLFAPDDRCRGTCYDYGQFDCRCPTTLERTTVHVAGGPTTLPSSAAAATAPSSG